MSIESKAADSGDFSVPVIAQENSMVVSVDDLMIASEEDLALLNSSISSTVIPAGPVYINTVVCESPTVALYDGLDDDQIYKVVYSLDLTISSSDSHSNNNFYVLNFKYGNNVLYSVDQLHSVDYVSRYDVSDSGVFYDSGFNLKNSKFKFSAELLSMSTTGRTISIDYDFTDLTITPVSSSEASDYESGYNAGYSAGLLDGEASVDTDAIYNEAYQAGYTAGLADGSDDTLKDDKVLLETVSNEFTLPGQVINSYYQQYITGPSLSIANGGLTNTMSVPMGYLFDVGKDYLIDLRSVTVSNSNEEIEVTLGEYVSHRISNLPTFTLSGPGLYMTSRGEVIYSPNQTGEFNLRVTVPAELVLRSTYSDAIEDDYVDIPSYGYANGILNWDSTFNYVIDVYEIDIVEEIDYLRDQSNKLSDLNNTQQESLDTMKETQETTKGIFSSIQDFFGSFFQNLIDSVIGLFVPSTEEMSGLFDQLNQFFSDRFGFLYAPFDYMIQLLDVFISSTGDTGLTFPGFSIMGYEVWPDMTYDISEDPLVGQIFQYVRMGTGILLAGWFVMYLQDFFKERFSQG